MFLRRCFTDRTPTVLDCRDRRMLVHLANAGSAHDHPVVCANRHRCFSEGALQPTAKSALGTVSASPSACPILTA
jgi:hypothetical protein